MKNISLGLNALLILAVAVLYYFQFSETAPLKEEITTVIETEEIKNSTGAMESKIGYVNIDSLQNNYKLYNELLNKLKSRERRYEKELSAKSTVFEKKVVEFQKKAATMTQFEGQLKQKALAEEEQKLYKMRDDFALKFQKEQVKLNEELQLKIKDYVKAYNVDKNYDIIIGATKLGNMMLYFNEEIDVSTDITAGLNKQYDKEKSQPESTVKNKK
jgi:outer membrane protein